MKHRLKVVWIIEDIFQVLSSEGDLQFISDEVFMFDSYDKLASSGKSMVSCVTTSVDMFWSTAELPGANYFIVIIMTIVLPGERAPARHVNLKLGPGLFQNSNASTSTGRAAPSIFATRAGTLNHSSNGSKWWIESNARRVSYNVRFFSNDLLIYLYLSMCLLLKNP